MGLRLAMLGEVCGALVVSWRGPRDPGLRRSRIPGGPRLVRIVSALFGVDGLQVTDGGPGHVLEVWAVTDHLAAAAYPGCRSSAGNEYVLARPRDVCHGLDWGLCTG